MNIRARRAPNMTKSNRFGSSNDAILYRYARHVVALLHPNGKGNDFNIVIVFTWRKESAAAVPLPSRNRE